MNQRTTLNKTVGLFIAELGSVFADFLAQDSGNKSYGIQTTHGPKWLKVLNLQKTPLGDLQTIVRFYNSLNHPSIPQNWQLVELVDGLVLMSDWVQGKVLSSPTINRQDPTSTYQQFQRLPLAKRLQAFATILELFVEIEAQSIIVEDFYDGSILYDFATDIVYVCDLDHIHHGSYHLQRERQFGSRRFMAPEEFCRGSLIDSRTNVFTLGATGFVLLNNNKRDRQDWPLAADLHQILQKATAHEPADRFVNIATLYQAWQTAVSPITLPTQNAQLPTPRHLP